MGDVTPVRDDDEEETGERERAAREDMSCRTESQLRDLRRGETGPSDRDEQESDFCPAQALVRKSKDAHAQHSPCVSAPVSRQDRATANAEPTANAERAAGIWGGRRI